MARKIIWKQKFVVPWYPKVYFHWNVISAELNSYLSYSTLQEYSPCRQKLKQFR
jgi:hypothetical protein